MRKTISTLMLAALGIPAFSQITLTQSNYPLPTATVPLQNISTQVTTAPAMGNNQTWDYSALTAGAATSNSYVAVSGDANFPTAQFKVIQNTKSLTSNLGYYFDAYYEITASGASMIGIYVPAQNYGLGALSGNASDTLYILENILNFSATPRTIVGFPATANSSWSSSIRLTVDMQLSVAAASLNKAPMQQAFYWNRMDTVIGWGTLKLPAQSGFNSNVPVLQDRISQYAIDSVYVGGSPAPPSLTTPFGITQGQKSGPMYNRVVFYREGEFNYQMLVNFDTTFTSILSAYVNTDLPAATGINDVKADGYSAAYPNPMSGRTFDIQTAASAQVAAVCIEDMSGRMIERISTASNNGLVHVQTAATLSDGLYIYSLIGSDGSVIGKGKIVTAK